MTEHFLTAPYPPELLLSLKTSPEEFEFALARFGLSPIDLDPGELAEDVANA